jgi:3-oxoadipate CoA-transferase beta subunit
MSVVNKLTRPQMARLVAEDIADGAYVNLGIGMPTQIAQFLPVDREVILHSENGIIGMAPIPPGAEPDPDLIDAGKEPVSLAMGASICDHLASFAMMRGGHIDLTVLGAFQVSEAGDLANWDSGEEGSLPAVGGAMDLVVGARRVYVMMEHVTKTGQAKIVRACSYPLTGLKVVDRIYTDYAIIDVNADGLTVCAMVEGMDLEALQAITDAPLKMSGACGVLSSSEAAGTHASNDIEREAELALPPSPSHR